jgi:hypothetical protein
VRHVEVDPRDPLGLGTAGQIGVKGRIVVIRLRGKRFRVRAYGEDLLGMPIGRQEGHPVATRDQPARDGEQRSDVADGWA